MENPIKLIHKFNREAGLIDQGYDDFRESSYQIEEALEGFNLKWLIRDLHDDALMDNANAKQVSRSIMRSATEEAIHISDVDRLDKACDAVVFAVGSMAKLGLNPQEITKALNVVMHANFAKLQCPKDEFGKLTKPADFVGPEAELQKILLNRSSK
jgi:predicted HAD superfamily Cof-like phosphohydrolase